MAATIYEYEFEHFFMKSINISIAQKPKIEMSYLIKKVKYHSQKKYFDKILKSHNFFLIPKTINYFKTNLP